MEEKVISILKDRTISISKIILKNYKKLNISDTELIIMMVLMSFGDKVMYNPEELASVISTDKYEVMSVINKLVEKNIISFEVEKIDKKTYEYLSLDLFYDKLFNLSFKFNMFSFLIFNQIFVLLKYSNSPSIVSK